VLSETSEREGCISGQRRSHADHATEQVKNNAVEVFCQRTGLNTRCPLCLSPIANRLSRVDCLAGRPDATLNPIRPRSTVLDPKHTPNAYKTLPTNYCTTTYRSLGVCDCTAIHTAYRVEWWKLELQNHVQNWKTDNLD